MQKSEVHEEAQYPQPPQNEFNINVSDHNFSVKFFPYSASLWML